MDEEFTFDLALVFGIGLVLLAIGYYVKQALTSNAAKTAATTVGNVAGNATTGQLTKAQVQTAICNEAAAIQKASGGRYTAAQAKAIATADQTAIHNVQENAPPVSIWCLFGLSSATTPCTSPARCGCIPQSPCTFIGICGSL